jgi:hypothetical protein
MIDTPTPPVTMSEEDPRYRVRFRMQQIVLSLLTIAAVVWLWMLDPEHPYLGIAAAFFAKHILVAIFLTGNRLPPLDAKEEAQ